jgi:hypothetical protein
MIASSKIIQTMDKIREIVKIFRAQLKKNKTKILEIRHIIAMPRNINSKVLNSFS